MPWQLRKKQQTPSNQRGQGGGLGTNPADMGGHNACLYPGALKKNFAATQKNT